MDLRTTGMAYFLIKQIMDPTVRTKPRIPYEAQKPPFADNDVKNPFERALPESVGLSSDAVADFIDEIGSDPTLDMHHVMILRGGKVVSEADFNGCDINIWHITHSECKSVTGLAIGILIGEGRLTVDTRVADIFESRVGIISRFVHRDITVRHLLEMTSGVMFNEAGSVTETDWVKCFLESNVVSEPGKRFSYNSMNTYMLSAIVRELTGQGLCEYLSSRLFEPMGIEDIFWEKCPRGIEKGGWGLYIRAEDMAKLGQLVLDGGIYNGRRLVPEEWMTEAVKAKQEPDHSLGDYDYGWQIWRSRERPAFLFNGMFGQNVLGDLRSGTLIISNAGNNELFQQSSFYTYAGRFLDKVAEKREPYEDAEANQRLRAAEKRYTFEEKAKRFPHCPFDAESFLAGLDGRVYTAVASKCLSVGLNPLYAQAIQNNFTEGFTGLRFSYEGGELNVTVCEGDCAHKLPVGFEQPRRTTLYFHGEPQYAAVSGRLTTDEDDVPVLKLRVDFLETANARLMKLFFRGDKLDVIWSESPGKKYLIDSYSSLLENAETNALVKGVLALSDENQVEQRISAVFEPKTETSMFDAK